MLPLRRRPLTTFAANSMNMTCPESSATRTRRRWVGLFVLVLLSAVLDIAVGQKEELIYPLQMTLLDATLDSLDEVARSVWQEATTQHVEDFYETSNLVPGLNLSVTTRLMTSDISPVVVSPKEIGTELIYAQNMVYETPGGDINTAIDFAMDPFDGSRRRERYISLLRSLSENRTTAFDSVVSVSPVTLLDDDAIPDFSAQIHGLTMFMSSALRMESSDVLSWDKVVADFIQEYWKEEFLNGGSTIVELTDARIQVDPDYPEFIAEESPDDENGNSTNATVTVKTSSGTGVIKLVYDQAVEYRAPQEVVPSSHLAVEPFSTTEGQATFIQLLKDTGVAAFANITTVTVVSSVRYQLNQTYQQAFGGEDIGLLNETQVVQFEDIVSGYTSQYAQGSVEDVLTQCEMMHQSLIEDSDILSVQYKIFWSSETVAVSGRGPIDSFASMFYDWMRHEGKKVIKDDMISLGVGVEHVGRAYAQLEVQHPTQEYNTTTAPPATASPMEVDSATTTITTTVSTTESTPPTTTTTVAPRPSTETLTQPFAGGANLEELNETQIVFFQKTYESYLEQYAGVDTHVGVESTFRILDQNFLSSRRRRLRRTQSEQILSLQYEATWKSNVSDTTQLPKLFTDWMSLDDTRETVEMDLNSAGIEVNVVGTPFLTEGEGPTTTMPSTAIAPQGTRT